jgi:hypothetical protein
MSAIVRRGAAKVNQGHAKGGSFVGLPGKSSATKPTHFDETNA